MPNWVTNSITITCDNDEILDAYFNIVGHQGESFDFDKIIPMPKELEIPSGSDTEAGITCVKWFAHPDCPETSDIIPKMIPEQYIFLLKQLGENQDVDINALALEMCKVRKIHKVSHLNENDHDLAQQDWEGVLQLGKQACSNAMAYGATDWYDWCRSNWGTKWNVNQPGSSIIEADGGVWFETAWSAPMPILRRIVTQLASTKELHGTATIEHRWADEDLGSNCGEQTFGINFDDADPAENISWYMRTDDDMGYDTAHDFAMNLWGWEDES